MSDIPTECEIIQQADQCLVARMARGLKDGPIPIQVWPFAQAPEDLQVLSRHGGDEDWIAAVPEMLDNVIDFGQLAICDASRHVLPRSGMIVYIGAHA